MRRVDLSVLILSWNTKDETLACLRALAADTPRYSREIIVIDNASADGSADAIAASFPDVTLVRNRENRMYAGGNNQAAALASGRYYCLLNSDTEVKPGALDTLVDFLENNDQYAAASAKLLNADGSVQPTCSRQIGLVQLLVNSSPLRHTPVGRWVKEHTCMAEFDHLTSLDVEQPATSCCLVRATDWEAIDGFDESIHVYFTDVDLCRRILERGRKIRYVAEAEVYHGRGVSCRKHADVNTIWFRDRNTFYRKYYGKLGDYLGQAVMRMYELELLARITLGPRRGEEKRLAKEAVRDQVRRVLSKEPLAA